MYNTILYHLAHPRPRLVQVGPCPRPYPWQTRSSGSRAHQTRVQSGGTVSGKCSILHILWVKISSWTPLIRIGVFFFGYRSKTPSKEFPLKYQNFTKPLFIGYLLIRKTGGVVVFRKGGRR